MDTHRRTLAKVITYQLSGLVVMTVIGAIFTGSAGAGGALALVSAVIGSMSYFLHERVWALVAWGRSSAGGTLSLSPAATGEGGAAHG